MKLLLVFLCAHAMFSLAFAAVLQQDVEFEKTAEDGSMSRFQTVDLASSDEEKRYLSNVNCGDTCKSGYVQSKYCTTAAKYCFGSSGQVVHVRFSTPFQNNPNIMIGLSLLDTHKDYNVRVRATPESISQTGFLIRLKPWGDGIAYQIGVRWMACP